MLFTITFKSPDSVDAELDAIERQNPEERDAAAALIEKYVKYGEYIILEFDTDDGTCVVRKNR